MRIDRLVVIMALLLMTAIEAWGQDKPSATADLPQRPARRVVQAADGSIQLLAIDAQVQGRRARIEKKGSNPHNIGYWTEVKDTASWEVEVKRAGNYVVEVEYSLDKRSEGSAYVIEVGGKKLEVTPKVTGTWLDFQKVKVGKMEIPEGVTTVTVRPTKKPGQAVLDLRGIRFAPHEKE